MYVSVHRLIVSEMSENAGLLYKKEKKYIISNVLFFSAS